jgi:hypothetical protein
VRKQRIQCNHLVILPVGRHHVHLQTHTKLHIQCMPISSRPRTSRGMEMNPIKKKAKVSKTGRYIVEIE